MIARRSLRALGAATALLTTALVAGALTAGASGAASAASQSQHSGSSWTAGGLIDVDQAATAPLPLGTQTQSQAPATSSAPGGGFAQVGTCTFYATSASAGGYCGHSGGGSHPPSLQAWLDGRPFVPCRFLPVPPGMVLNTGSAPGGTWMLKACFANWDPTEPWGGHDMIVDIYAQWVPDGTDISIPGYMLEFWSYAARTNFYPVPRISVGPTVPALVGTYTYFWATWVEAQDSAQPAKEDYRIAYDTGTAGTVYLHMKVHDVVVHPGIPEMDEVHCGLAKVAFDDSAADAIPRSEGGSQDSECWLRYEHSTAFHDTLTVLIHADAYWRVTVEDEGGRVLRNLGDFHYTAYQRLAVAEVQTLVDW